ncbi:cytochrome P450 [Streptomyces sp. NPDC045431]|uniref:cytochrome P450 n=1 Tax=Streptomyces sp. NPDC045431 TaxID=3155613 RepID=UPI0033F8B734
MSPARYGIGLERLGPLPAFMAHGEEAVVPIAAPTGDMVWLVRDYELGRLVLTDKRFSRAEAVKPHVPKFNDAQPVPDSMMSMDGAEHARLRRVVTGAFTGRRMAALAPAIERMADERLDRLVEAGPPGDLVEELALPLPRAVLCSLLGVPAQDGDRFRDLVEVLFDITASTPKEKSRRRVELVDYMAGLLERKRERPEDDLLTAMIRVHDQGEMSMAELVTMGLTLLMAGYETTVGQIGLSALALLSDPDAYKELRGRPEALPSAVEEFLRLTPATPVSFTRVAVEPVPLDGVTIAAGEAVVVSLLHGNRDGKVFAEPEHLVPEGRDAVHLTFGHGVHRCLGAPLAKLQVQIVLERLLRRFPELRPAAGAPEPVVWKDGLLTRGLSRLLVEW